MGLGLWRYVVVRMEGRVGGREEKDENGGY